jgi:ATP-dependent Lon protease
MSKVPHSPTAACPGHRKQLDDRQRKFLLREHLKTIQHELGKNGGEDAEIARLEEAIARSGMPALVLPGQLGDVMKTSR